MSKSIYVIFTSGVQLSFECIESEYRRSDFIYINRILVHMIDYRNI